MDSAKGLDDCNIKTETPEAPSVLEMMSQKSPTVSAERLSKVKQEVKSIENKIQIILEENRELEEKVESLEKMIPMKDKKIMGLDLACAQERSRRAAVKYKAQSLKLQLDELQKKVDVVVKEKSKPLKINSTSEKEICFTEGVGATSLEPSILQKDYPLEYNAQLSPVEEAAASTTN